MNRLAAVLFCVIPVITAASAQTPLRGYPVSADQVAGAIARAGVPVTASQIGLPAGLVAAANAPALKVRSMQRQGDGKLLARIECANPAQCLPFFAWVRMDEAMSVTSSLTQPSVSQAPPIVIRRGSTATLLLDGDHVHIRIAVVSEENGVPGQTIRVTGKENRMVYAATVIDGAMLKGRL